MNIRKRMILCLAGCLLCMVPVHSQESAKTKTEEVDVTVEKLYETFLPILERVEIVGNGPIGSELKGRWGQMVDYLKNNKSSMAEEVKDLLMTPGGVPLNFENMTKYIELNTTDSITRIRFNPDAMFEEIRAASDKLVKAAKDAARTK